MRTGSVIVTALASFRRTGLQPPYVASDFSLEDPPTDPAATPEPRWAGSGRYLTSESLVTATPSCIGVHSTPDGLRGMQQ